MVCHSAKSKEKRYRWARNRFSKNGIHNQCAEGIQSAFKTAMRNYRYFKPVWSQLYATEWSYLKNLKYFGEGLIPDSGGDTHTTVGIRQKKSLIIFYPQSPQL